MGKKGRPYPARIRAAKLALGRANQIFEHCLHEGTGAGCGDTLDEGRRELLGESLEAYAKVVDVRTAKRAVTVALKALKAIWPVDCGWQQGADLQTDLELSMEAMKDASRQQRR